MELHHISFYKNGMLQGAGDGLPGEDLSVFSYCLQLQHAVAAADEMYAVLASSIDVVDLCFRFIVRATCDIRRHRPHAKKPRTFSL
jgi:hypothetical protein